MHGTAENVRLHPQMPPVAADVWRSMPTSHLSKRSLPSLRVKSHLTRAAALLVAVGLAACGKSTPTRPSEPSGPERATVAFGNITVSGNRTSAGFEYGATFRVQESAGLAVTVTSVELTVLANGAALASAQFNDAFVGKVAGGSIAESRALKVTDNASGNPYASQITTRVQFVDDKQNQGTITRTDSLPALAAAPAIVTWTVTPGSITAGQSANLQWSVADSSSVEIDNGIGAVPASGQRSVSPGSTTTYVIKAVNSVGTTERSVTLTVNAAPGLPPPPTIGSFSVDRTTITIGQSVTFTWCADGATSVSISGVGGVSSCGSRLFTPLGTRDYVLSASNAGGTTTRTVRVTANVPVGICAAADVPGGATAICRDGWTSQSQNRQGTCSSHGGVSCWVCPGALCNGAVAGERTDATPRWMPSVPAFAVGIANPLVMSVVPDERRVR